MSPLKIIFNGKEYFCDKTLFDHYSKEAILPLFIEENKNPFADFNAGMEGPLIAIYDDEKTYACYEFDKVIITCLTRHIWKNKVEMSFKILGKFEKRITNKGETN